MYYSQAHLGRPKNIEGDKPCLRGYKRLASWSYKHTPMTLLNL